MTKEQAKKFANCLKNNYTIDFNDMADFCDMVIKALEQQSSEDCVSRAEVHKMLENIPITNCDKWFNWLQKACLRLEALPPVTTTHGTCKDCIHRDPEDKKCYCGHSIVWQLPREDNWYCADYEKAR